MKVRLCDWRYRAILRDRQVLDYAAAYFQLDPIARRIYEVARATGPEAGAQGDDARLEVDLATFRLQIGYQNPLSNFRAALKQIAGTDLIPDYDLALVEGEAPVEGGGRGRRAAPVSVVITRRPAALPDAEAVG